MTERQMQFRVGLLVIVAAVVAGGLVFRFGEMRWLWEKHYTLGIHFDDAPGVERGTPVRKNGILIGSVRELTFDDRRGGVNVVVQIRERHLLRKDSVPMLTRSLLGDATIEFSPGKSRDLLRPGDRVEGRSSEDPVELVTRIESRLNDTLNSFTATSEEWRRVGENFNGLMETHRGRLDRVVAEAADSLHEFTLTMRSANEMLGDPANQEHLRETLAALPAMMNDTRETVHAIRAAVARADATLTSVAEATAPLARRSQSIVTKLDSSVGHLETLMSELSRFARAVGRENGSLNLLVSDPELYRNLNQSAAALSLLLKNLEPAMRDLRVFADKVARHPELIGVSGAIQPSSGLK